MRQLVTFTKWVDPSFPFFKGVAGGGVPGDFAPTVLERTAFDNGTIVYLRAKYEVIGDDPARSFKAEIEGKNNVQTSSAVRNEPIMGRGAEAEDLSGDDGYPCRSTS